MTFSTVAGRSAFRVLASWGLLRIPVALTGEKAFAIEVDVYSPSTVATQAPGLTVFSDWGPAPVQRSKGINEILLATAGSLPVLGTMVWVNGDSCDGWGGGQVCSPGHLRQTAPAPDFSDAWRTLRVEGNRSTCEVKTLLDGKVLDRYAGTCDLTGGGVVLEGHDDTAFSRLRIYRATTAACFQ
ncbi:MAG: hypothetical protein U0229_24470 [Anaeromyxobacter sp.]